MRRLGIALAAVCFIALSPGALAQDLVYRVKNGDNIWSLCHGFSNYKNCWLQLGDYNDLPNDDMLEPGSRLRIPIHWLRIVPEVGEALTVSGEVTYKPYAGPAVPLKAGKALTLGATLTSGEGNASIRLGDHGVILLRPNSVLELDSMTVGGGDEPSSELVLPSGDIEVEVKPEARSRFEVHTPAAVAAVRGTRYRVSATGTDSMRSEVTAGLVAITANSTVDVPAGFGVQARTGQAVEAPRELLAAPAVDKASLHAPLPVSVRWAQQPGAVRWQLDLFESGEDGKLLLTRQIDQPQWQLDNLEQSCYRLRLRAIDADGFNGLDTEEQLCVLAPAPVEPEPNAYRELGIWSILTALIFL